MIAAASLVFAVAMRKPLLLAHFMPWFEAPPTSKAYGFHWTMNKVTPPKKLASKFTPLIGPYDSGDPDVIDCQLLLMKLAGFDGLLADWYGPKEFWDYGVIQRNTVAVFKRASQLGLQIGVVYEDQSVKHQIEAGALKPQDGPQAVAEALSWLDQHWLQDPRALKLNGKPALFVFGPQYLTDAQWTGALGSMTTSVSFFTLHNRKGSAVGAYDWPLPDQGVAQVDRFNRAAKPGASGVAAAYPRFEDFYGQAGVQKSFPVIPDNDGQTYQQTLAKGIASGLEAVQVATWNDWGEGTQIEPSVEFGYRDLEETQRQRRKFEPTFPFKATDLRLPIQVFLKLKDPRYKAVRDDLRLVNRLLAEGKTQFARRRLEGLTPR